ncbi:hypothetical protein SAY87_005062 [Trapa incisa]|uniref:Uncharacterized protein n=1 Tax=Trapa incisa TaxID=236973 RepID=A0AAN7PTZ5_9MYRT|nr:hypothetical protein SAY87_005062 [Trapa incisa]
MDAESVRNYLEDQLLGVALFPRSEVIVKKGQLEKEFSLSSTDLFHNPAGFVQLSLLYNGASPESGVTDPILNELDKIEFPDPKIVNESEMMVSEYFRMPCENLESEASESLVTSCDTDETQLHSEENFSKGVYESIQTSKLDSPMTSGSTNDVSSTLVPASSHSSETPTTPIQSPAPSEEHESEPPNAIHKAQNGHSESLGGVCGGPAKPVVSVNLELEKNAVQQQDIVDMYMKSMQQFTESLAKMNLPMGIETEKASPGTNSSSEENLQEASKN